LVGLARQASYVYQ